MSVCVLGARSFVGKNLLEGTNWVGVTREECDLESQESVRKYFSDKKFDWVIHCGVVGGSRLQKDSGEITYRNILMFENVLEHIGKSYDKLIYFSSGAALQPGMNREPYGLSKWVIDQRIKNIPGTYSLRIWGCYGPGELPTRFSAICQSQGHVVIEKDRYFDFIDVKDIKKIVLKYTNGELEDKEYNLVYPEKMLLSQWAEKFGATWEIKTPDDYVHSRTEM